MIGAGPLALRVGALAGLLLVLSGGGPAPERPDVPADSLPTPLERRVPLGAESLAAARSASAAEVALGRRLFFEARLSSDGRVACASCHRPENAFADDRARSRGVDGQETHFNSPSLLNKGLSRDLRWRGGAAGIEEQVLAVLESPVEMGLGVEGALEFLRGEPSYAAAFVEVYDGPPGADELAGAIAAFVRELVVGDSPVDRFRAGQVGALSAQEQAGLWLFEGRGGCWRCHSGPNFTDEAFHNTGVGAKDGVALPGRAAVTGRAADRGAFRTPGLRHLLQSAPYMHDGSQTSLREVVEFYRRGGGTNGDLDPELRPLDIDDEDVESLVAFLEALSR